MFPLPSLRPGDRLYLLIFAYIFFYPIVCRKWFLISGGFFVATLPEEMSVSDFYRFIIIIIILLLFFNKNVTLVAIYPKQLKLFFGSSLHAVNKCGAVDHPAELSWFLRLAIKKFLLLDKLMYHNLNHVYPTLVTNCSTWCGNCLSQKWHILKRSILSDTF